jgi:hypothetical protein
MQVAVREQDDGACALLPLRKCRRALSHRCQLRFCSKYPVNDKTALAEVADFTHAPQVFAPRVQKTLANLGGSTEELVHAVERVEQLLHESVELARVLYRPRFTLPK